MTELTESERESLAAGFAAGWASVLDDDDAEFVQTDPEAMQAAYHYADLIAPTVMQILDARRGRETDPQGASE